MRRHANRKVAYNHVLFDCTADCKRKENPGGVDTPGVLESFLFDRERGEEMLTPKVVDVVRSNWVGMWGLDTDGDAGFERAHERHMNLVLNSHREERGGEKGKDIRAGAKGRMALEGEGNG